MSFLLLRSSSSGFSLPSFSKAIAKTRAGTANTTVLCAGDSTTFGTGSNNSNVGDLKPGSYPTQLATIYSAILAGRADSFMGYGSTSSENNASNDARVVEGSSWVPFTGNPALGGTLFKNATSSTNALSFTPTTSVDTFKVTYVTASGNGVLQADINGSGATTQNTAGANGFGNMTISGTLGTNTLNLKWSSGGNVFVQGIVAYNSAQKSVNFINAGWPGATAAQVNGTVSFFDSQNGLKFVAPDLTLLMIGINDWLNATSLTTFTTAVQGLITAAKLSGDVIVIAPPASAVSSATLATQKSYVDILSAQALAANVPFLNVWATWGPQENNLSRYWTGNPVHPNNVGYLNIAQLILDKIRYA